MLKFHKKVLFLFLAVAVISLFTACGKHGTLNPNQKPIISISSYEGADSLAATVGDTLIFQQKIYWNAYDTDGIVKGYAYRVLDENNNPVATPGHDIIDGDGWVYHYGKGSNHDIPLAQSPSKTIWNDIPSALINFPANVDGVAAQVISKFQLKCIDNRGEESDIITKYFSCKANAHTVSISTTKGEVDNSKTGKGLVFVFKELGDLPFVEDIPYYFFFKVAKRNIASGEIIQESDWYDTKDFKDVEKVEINENTTPGLVADEFDSDDNPITETLVIAKCVDEAGIISEPDTVAFYVKDGFSPVTMFYPNYIFNLGNYHYTNFQPSALGQVIPTTNGPDGRLHYSTPYFRNINGEYAALWDPSFKTYIRWGWHGEYVGDNPAMKKNAVVYDSTGVNYFCDIRYFDLRFDGDYYNYPPLVPQNIITDEDGKKWLRVRSSDDIFQSTVLSQLEPGVHNFEVRAVDTQNVEDPTSAVFTFNLIEPQFLPDKNGVLIIDDGKEGFPGHQEDAKIDSIYRYLFSDYGTKSIDRDSLKTNPDIYHSTLHFDRDVLSPTDIVNYKTIVYCATDLKKDDVNFQNEYDVLNLYRLTGGNIILISTANLYSAYKGLDASGGSDFFKLFGIDTDLDNPIEMVSPSLSFGSAANPFFVGADATVSNYPAIDLQLPSDNQLLNMLNGLGVVSYIPDNNILSNATVLYRLRCKPVGDGSHDPSQEQFETYNNQPVALSSSENLEYNYKTFENKYYLITFPLNLMDLGQAKEMITNVMQEIQ
jgi:hypothetical protein